MLENEIKNLRKQMVELSSNMSEIMIKLLNLESNEDNQRNNIQLPHIQEKTNHQTQFKCEL